MSVPCALPITYRLATPGDRAYVIDTWLQSYRGSQFAMKLPDFVYWSRFGHVGLVEHLVEHEDILIAGLPDDPSWMYGWLCHGTDVVHYVFTRGEFRNQGVARALLTADGFCASAGLGISHITIDFSRGLGRGREVKFVNPYRSEKR